MSEKEQAKQMIDCLPDYKIPGVLFLLKRVQSDDDFEDDLFCEKLVEDYLDDPDPEKHSAVTLEELAAREGIAL